MIKIFTILEKFLNILVLLCSIVILLMISAEILGKVTLYGQDFIDNTQLWICIIFLADFFVRLYLSPHKGRFLLHNVIFLIVAIPYIAIINHFDIKLSGYEYIFVRSIPLIRGAYGISIVINWLTQSKITNLFASYISTVIAITYFSSVIFFSIEKNQNPLVLSYWDALWWACMDITTVGSNIYAVTPIGKVLSVFLAALGMMMFPIFTVYITSKFKDKKQSNTN